MPKPSAHLATDYTWTMVELLVRDGVEAELTAEPAPRLSSLAQEIVQRRLTYNQQITTTRKWRNWQTHQT
jgi:hypothetical protein